MKGSVATKTVTAKQFKVKPLHNDIEWELELAKEDALLLEGGYLFISLQEGEEIPEFVTETGDKLGGVLAGYIYYSYNGDCKVNSSEKTSLKNTGVAIKPETTYSYSVWAMDYYGNNLLCIAQGTLTTPTALSADSTDYVSNPQVKEGFTYLELRGDYDADVLGSIPVAGFEVCFTNGEEEVIAMIENCQAKAGHIYGLLYPYAEVRASDGNTYTITELLDKATIKPYVKTKLNGETITLYAGESIPFAFKDFGKLQAKVTDVIKVSKDDACSIKATVGLTNAEAHESVRVAGVY